MALLSDAVFEMIQSRVKEQPEKAKSVNSVFLFNITKDGKQVKQWSKLLLLLFVYHVRCINIRSDGFEEC